MYKAVIFDLDGTLLDTISDISDSVNAVLKRKGYPEFSELEYKYFVGKGIDNLIHSIINVSKINPNEFEEIRKGYIKEYARRNPPKTKPYLGIIDMLIELRNEGIKICILSNKPHFQTEEVVKKHFRNIKFDLVYGKKDEYPIKPNPKSALSIIEKLKLSNSEVLYVGDTNIDMLTASNAQLKSVGVTWGFRKKQELVESGASYLVDKAEDIIKIVKGEGNDFKSE